MLQPQYLIVGDRWNTFLNVQYDQTDFKPTKPMKPDNSVKPTYEPEQIFQDSIVVAASSNLTSGNLTKTTTTTTIRPKLKKLVKKKLVRLTRASEKPIFLRQQEEPSEDATTTEITTEVASTDKPEITTIEENLIETTSNNQFTGYVYKKPTTQFVTPQPVYYDNNLIHDLNKFVPSVGSETWSIVKPSTGYGFSTNNKIELISLTTSYPPVSMDSFKPSSSDTFQNSKNYW